MTEHRVGFVDVGARGGASKTVARLREKLHCVLIEPDPDEAAKLEAAMANDEFCTVISGALGHADGMADLHTTVNAQCSSMLRVNYPLIDRYGIRKHFRFNGSRKVRCSRYDTLFGQRRVPPPHAVKVDVQGFEYQVLQGFGGLLHQCMALQIETHFYPIYENQATIGEMIRFLEAYDFVLRRISNPRSPELRGDRHFDGDLIEVDAVFTKSRHWLRSHAAARDDFHVACDALEIDIYTGI